MMAYRDMLVAIGSWVHGLIPNGKTLEETLAAKYDSRWGKTGSLSQDDMVTLIYNDLTGTRSAPFVL